MGRDNFPTKDIYPSSLALPVRKSPTFWPLRQPYLRPRFPVDDELSLIICDIWASMVNTLLLLIFQKPSTANNNATSHAQTAKLNDTLAWAGGGADGKGGLSAGNGGAK